MVLALQLLFMLTCMFCLPITEPKLVHISKTYKKLLKESGNQPLSNDIQDSNRMDFISENSNNHILEESNNAYFEVFKNSEEEKLKSVVRTQLEEGFKKDKLEKFKEFAYNIASFSSPFQGCSKDPVPSSESGNIKTYQINLDDNPEVRWNEVAKQKKNEIKKFSDFFEVKYGRKFMNVVDKYISWLYQTLPKEYFLELRGISEETGISIGRVTLYNVFYEFFSVCTSIVMEGEDGRMYHGRNLDLGILMGWDVKNHTWFLTEYLRPLIVKLEFSKNKRPLYSAVSYAGYTGILTGVKKNTFSLTIDERFKMNGGYVGLVEWVLGRRDVSWLGLLTRQVMESAESYQQAQKMLATTPLVAPTYYILAGNSSHQGCVVTRGRTDSDVWELGSQTTDQSGAWYLVETNYDHWRQTPFFDHRRQYAVQCMDQLGRKQPLDTLYKVLSTRPVYNKETTLTALMEVSGGVLQVWERECGDPCWPW